MARLVVIVLFIYLALYLVKAHHDTLLVLTPQTYEGVAVTWGVTGTYLQYTDDNEWNVGNGEGALTGVCFVPDEEKPDYYEIFAVGLGDSCDGTGDNPQLCFKMNGYLDDSCLPGSLRKFRVVAYNTLDPSDSDPLVMIETAGVWDRGYWHRPRMVWGQNSSAIYLDYPIPESENDYFYVPLACASCISYTTSRVTDGTCTCVLPCFAQIDCNFGDVVQNFETEECSCECSGVPSFACNGLDQYCQCLVEPSGQPNAFIQLAEIWWGLISRLFA